MAQIKADEITKLIREQIENYESQLDHAAGGRNVIGMQRQHFRAEQILGSNNGAGGGHDVASSITSGILP